MRIQEKLKPFTDEELYILYKTHKHGGFEIMNSNLYCEEERNLYSDLLKAISWELYKRRRKAT